MRRDGFVIGMVAVRRDGFGREVMEMMVAAKIHKWFCEREMVSVRRNGFVR